jgi:hypothetical protein
MQIFGESRSGEQVEITKMMQRFELTESTESASLREGEELG